MSRPTPSISPVTIPNQIGIKSSEVADALALEVSACVSGDKMALYFMHVVLQMYPHMQHPLALRGDAGRRSYFLLMVHFWLPETKPCRIKCFPRICDHRPLNYCQR